MTVRRDFENFLLPESSLSLKIVFDNIRNYLICGAVLGLVFWFQSGRATAPPILFSGPPRDGWQLLKWVSLVVFFLLFLLNAYQSYLIGRKAFRFLNTPPSNAGSADLTISKRLPWYVHMAVYAFAVIATNVLLWMVFLLTLFAVYFLWFA